ncbi:UNVERIFIED_CONTAM: hypothetical protein PYX00_007509 [Menopon gallinae]|uniref:Tyrosine decarboxylase n=1 Tax=Menopon gallinae TaxID=328185 RepID=A0AAW2HJB1_9NEOP
MSLEDFRVRGKEVIDFVCDYSGKVEGNRVTPDVEPGFLSRQLPKEAPKNGYHAYFPMGRGCPSLIADIITGVLGCAGSSWLSSPACTELETIVLDWLGKAMSIPPHFIYSTPGSTGGGVIQCSTSDCILVCMLAARTAAIKYLKEQNPDGDEHDSVYLPRLVAYTSKEAHAAVERCARIAMVRLRLLNTDNQSSLRGPTLADAVQSDQENGLHPFFVNCTLGTIGSCGFDNLKEIGPIVKKLPSCWLHVDASYAGCGFICPELRYLKEGMEFADSFNASCSKWLTITADCSCLWVKDRCKLTSSLITDPVLLQHERARQSIDYRNWGVQLSRSFKALKLWFTLRYYGVEGLQTYIRNHCKLAKEFEKLVSRDNRFELVNEVRVGLITFRLIGSDEKNQELLAAINKEGQIHMVPARVRDKYSLRFCITHPEATQAQVDAAWNTIQKHTAEVVDRQQGEKYSEIAEEDRKRYAFVEFVPEDLYYEWQSGTLTDGTGPMYVPLKMGDGTKTFTEDQEIYHDVKTILN